MPGRLPYVAWLVAIWVALWGDLTTANLLGGLVVALGLLITFPGAGPGPASRFRPVAVLRLGAFFVWSLVKANAILAWEISTPRRRLRPAIIAFPLQARSDAVVTLIANAITLTPGTLTLTVTEHGADRILYAHVLSLGEIAGIRDDFARLERLAIAAFGSTDEAA